MVTQFHNLGYLRMAVEDAIVALLTAECNGTVIRPAYTTDKQEFPCVVVHAVNTRERNETDYNLARYVDVEIRCISYAEAENLSSAREAHFALLASVYHSLASADIVAKLNDTGTSKVKFWSCYAKTDTGGTAESAYVSVISVEIGATPQLVS